MASRKRAQPEAAGSRKADVVARDLLEQIAHGELKVSAILPTEAELAARYAVNRSVVREAIKLLEVHRLVKPVRRRGTVVLDPYASLSPEVLRAMLRGRGGRIDLAFLESLLEIRAALDVQICALAAERRKKSDLEAMERQLEVMRGLSADDDAYTEATFQLGLLFAKATQNPVALMLSHWNRAVASDLPHVFGVARATSGPHLEGLSMLLDRFRTRDAEQARALVTAFHTWASPRILAAAALANGEPLTRVKRLKKELR
ncbi:MAG: FadR family transcriptional regulator [Deltaproteobacteria bacterium]|nr:FadR family transcriptional regulator [Deltaproteobacteria bacterium]